MLIQMSHEQPKGAQKELDLKITNVKQEHTVKLVDILYYLIDISISISALVEVQPKMAKYYLDSEVLNGFISLIEEQLDHIKNRIGSIIEADSIK